VVIKRVAHPGGYGHKQRPTSTLTERRAQYVALAAAGFTNKQIARELNVAPDTVKNTFTLIFDVLGATDRANAVYLCVKRRIIQ
jgi:DNA-binding NarL/FixJ family response regulator